MSHGLPASDPDVPRRARLGPDGGVLLRLLGYRDVGARAAIQPASGIAAMQAINVVVLNPLFLGTFFGTALLSLVLDIVALMDWSAPGSGYLVAGSLLYFVGTFLVTLLFNVPLNNKLAAVKPDSAEARRCGRITSVCGRRGTMCARSRRLPRWRPSSWPSAKCGVRRAAPRPPRSGSASSRCGRA